MRAPSTPPATPKPPPSPAPHHHALRPHVLRCCSTLSASRGLAIASDIGIFAQTASLAILLHRKRLVSLAHLEFAELARALARRARRLRRDRRRRPLPAARLHLTRRDVLTIAAASIAWAHRRRRSPCSPPAPNSPARSSAAADSPRYPHSRGRVTAESSRVQRYAHAAPLQT